MIDVREGGTQCVRKQASLNQDCADSDFQVVEVVLDCGMAKGAPECNVAEIIPDCEGGTEQMDEKGGGGTQMMQKSSSSHHPVFISYAGNF